MTVEAVSGEPVSGSSGVISLLNRENTGNDQVNCRYLVTCIRCLLD